MFWMCASTNRKHPRAKDVTSLHERIAVKMVHTSPSATVITNGLTSRSFTLHRGTRQGCPLSPSLFPFYRTVSSSHPPKQLHYIYQMLLSKATYRAFIHVFLSACVFSWNWTHNLVRCQCNALPLSHRNRNNANIKGVQTLNIQHKISLYADDILLYLQDPSSTLQVLIMLII